MLLSAEHLTLNFGLRRLLDKVDFYLEPGDKVGIIGINGTGKSSLLRVLAGNLEADAGSVRRDPGVRLSCLEQNPNADDSQGVLDYVLSQLPAEFRTEREYEVKSLLNRLALTEYEAKMGSLSGGQRKRASLAAALLRPAEILFLDEPTNHLDAEMTQWLEETLQKRQGGLVMVTHDRYFLERVVNRITELSRGRLYHYEANYSRYLELKAERAEMAEASERKRQSILRTEREWIMRGCRARSTKSKDRIERYEALLEQEAPAQDNTVAMTSASSRLGKKLIELEHVSKIYGEKTVIRDFSYVLKKTDRIGIVGYNGAGKTTLLRLLSGELSPTGGSVDIGSTVKLGIFSQEARELDPEMRVFDYIHTIAAEVRTNEGVFTATQLMERFLFPREQQTMKIGSLSGGEKRRLYLLGVLMAAPNVLMLDEPTNDLDVMTLSILEDYLADFPGPILTVSHDRFLLDRLSKQIFEVRDGEVLRYTGGWSDWQEKRREEAFCRAEKPKLQRERLKNTKLKFSFKEQREFETIDDDIAALEEKIAACTAEQEACCSDYVKLQELQGQQKELEAALDEKMERWVYLTELKEKIDGQ